eukprot:TRINITY_DN91318_c0_g1_i1.p1 TRINITY_DN91318_c0_g1~~TRINITY_DN91318_c0_g1_i1.p1  ORF type:complete len:1349 (-),score=270.27 TRINITY_DN91318_c0_g1_i1:87-4088(-)
MPPTIGYPGWQRVSNEIAEDSGWEVVSKELDDTGQDVTWTSELKFWLNGEEVIIQNPSPDLLLLDWLREDKGLRGTKVGCGEGGCGICTVALGRVSAAGNIEVLPINSCLRRLCALDGCHVITTEGLGSSKTGFHKLQTAIADGNGSQCGFCTPGWVMNMYALLDKSGASKPSREEVERHFDGNLCRCTGYRPILSAFGEFADGGKCCSTRKAAHPPCMLAHAASPQPLRYRGGAAKNEWWRPVSMGQLQGAVQKAVAEGLKMQLICAGTGAGVEKYLLPSTSPCSSTLFLDISLLPELQGCSFSEGGLHVGAAVSLSELISSLEAQGNSVYEKLAFHLTRVASVQIRSVASWAGNLMLTRGSPSFQSDVATVLATAGAKIEVLDLSTGMQTTLSTSDLLNSDGAILVLSMEIPKPSAGRTVFQTFKTAQRAAFAHAIVNFGARLTFEKDELTVVDAHVIVGGATKHLLEALETASVLKGKKLNQDTFAAAVEALKADIFRSASSDPRNSQQYRLDLATSFLYKTFLAACSKLPAPMKTAIVPFIPAHARPVSNGSSSYGVDKAETPVSDFIPKLDARLQASGEVAYASDCGPVASLVGQLVFTTHCGKLQAIDPAEALAMPGVRSFIDATCIPGLNCPTPALGADNLKEKLFFQVGDEIPCVGVPLGIMVADTWAQARAAAKCVAQRYGSQQVVVTSLEDAVKLKRTLTGAEHAAAQKAAGAAPSRHRGLRGKGAAEGVHYSNGQSLSVTQTATATFKTGGQRHFYMETQSSLAVPVDGGQMELVVSDQDANFTQQNVALVLKVPMHRINVKVPRAGGAFGAKLMRQCVNATAAAVAAHTLQRPVRIQNERSDDCASVAGREPIDFEYEASFDATGKIDTCNMKMTMDPGWFYGDASGDMDMAVGWSDNCYQWNSWKVTPVAATTNTPHSTPMRAPGCMQSILAAEVVMEHIAKTVGKPVEEVQAANFYDVSTKPTTPFGDHIGQYGYNWTIPQLWTTIQESAQFAMRQKDIEAYNSANRWTKKGIAISPCKYVMGIDFYSSGALVCVYADGTVLISTGGSEVGQGLNTKVSMCAAQTLGLPLEKILVGPRETSKIPNNTGTGGSGTSECTSQAVIQACEEVLEKLKPYREGKSWEDAVQAANTDHISLVASSWFTSKKSGNTNLYATYGTAVSEVLVDVLTGEVRLERMDVLMDFGTQLDAAVDIGQLQGGMVMALGFLLTEELKVDASGTQLNLGTWDYKIPMAYDIPLQFNVSLLKDTPNPVGIRSSKASAEPSMCLVSSVYLAVKQAIYAARKELSGDDSWFMLNTPLTPERVRTAIAVPADKMTVPA